jgi:hypothetical protein
MTEYGDRLLPQHQAMLAASGIPADHARARGYLSITTGNRKMLKEIGIVKSVHKSDGLLIPLLRIDGEPGGYQFRPDTPRIKDGKELKYETPWRQPNMIDFPPGVAERLKDRDTPIWITEGVKKADAGYLAGLAIVGLTGVWNWLRDGAALPDFRDLALKNREVILCFDSDITIKDGVWKAVRDLGQWLKLTRQANVKYCLLPHNGDGKTGLDDYLAAGHTVDDLLNLVQPDLPEVIEARSHSPSETTATPQHSWSGGIPAIALLRRILDRLAEEVRARGLVGEERLAQTLYLVQTSRLLDKQVSAGVKGHSASGKSHAVETVTKFFPKESYLEFTAMSEKALVYSTEEYAHRTLIVYEIVALREGVEDDMTSYFIRSLLSEGRIEYPVTVRDQDGGFTTKTIIKEGPTNLIFTTTKTRVHAENETRILSLATDDSREQTARVFLELADEERAGSDLSEWQDLQRWLASAEHRVTIPYARELVEKIPPVAVRLRRDVGSLLALIRSHAVLHQANRGQDEQGRIVADLDDYAVVRDLVADIMAEGVGATVSETVREIVDAVTAIATADGVQLRPLADKLSLDKSNVSRRLARAADGGYVRNLEDKRGKPGRWVIGDPLPEAADLLPNPAQLCNTENEADKDRCGVAVDSDRESDATDGGSSDPSDPSDSSDMSEGHVNDPELPFIERCNDCGERLDELGFTARCRPNHKTTQATSPGSAI